MLPKMLFPIEGLAEIREKCMTKYKKENNIYDPEFEKELEYRLSNSIFINRNFIATVPTVNLIISYRTEN